MHPSASHRRRSCHWGHIDGPRRHGPASRTRVWICEYPYRTIRTSGPDPDCEGCRQYMAQAAYLQRLEWPPSALTH